MFGKGSFSTVVLNLFHHVAHFHNSYNLWPRSLSLVHKVQHSKAEYLFLAEYLFEKCNYAKFAAETCSPVLQFLFLEISKREHTAYHLRHRGGYHLLSSCAEKRKILTHIKVLLNGRSTFMHTFATRKYETHTLAQNSQIDKSSNISLQAESFLRSMSSSCKSF